MGCAGASHGGHAGPARKFRVWRFRVLGFRVLGFIKIVKGSGPKKRFDRKFRPKVLTENALVKFDPESPETPRKGFERVKG